MQCILVNFRLLSNDEWVKGKRGFPIYREVLGICPDFEKNGSAQENVGQMESRRGVFNTTPTRM